jgi:hypothetical protein
LDGETALISGTATYVFERTDGQWQQQSKFDVTGDVAVDGDTALVGGTVLLRDTNGWHRETTLSPTSSGGQFGWSVGLSGNTALVGDWQSENSDGVDTGATFAFDLGVDVTGNGEPATDIDDDGAAEDINGDGTVTGADAQALFTHRNDPLIKNTPEKFDFNDDGEVDIVDIQALISEEGL